MLILFAVTIFTGAALLFLLQPMFARMVLPLLGGAPAVWNTAMVFYQAALLLGYAYAHASTSRLAPRRQTAVQAGLLLLPFLVLPIAIPPGWTPPTSASPIPWLLALMTVGIGLPFFVVATMSPVLQKWFAATGHPHSADPYFLYSASNLGSMLALLGYPLLLEPRLSLAQQARFWTWGYGIFVLLAFGCAACAWREPRSAVASTTPPLRSLPITGQRRARWVLLAFVPSSLMLGVTTFLTSEIAVVPLLWIVPLSLYLLTFVAAFRPGTGRALGVLGRAFSILVVTLVVALNMGATQPLGWIMLLHLLVFTLVALLCHTRLAIDRPDPKHLTEFYLWLSVGGVLGGAFNALLAPLFFTDVIEYPLVIVLAALLVTGHETDGGDRRQRILDWVWPLALGAAALGLVLAVQTTRYVTVPSVNGVLFGLPALGCFFFSRRRVRFAAGLAALLIAGHLYRGERGQILHAERSFFGVHRVTHDITGKFHLLVHGRTLHGTQSLEPEQRKEALAYYHRTGPAGEILSFYGHDPAKKIGVVGLGAGSLAAFAQPAQSWTFFEIDPVVEKLARDPRYFTFLSDSPGRIHVVLGDARWSLVHTPAREFDLLLVDAFSSDAIPVHLVTREALALYDSKLTDHGILAFHISNLHLDLEPVLAALAKERGFVALVRDDTGISPTEHALGKQPSVWLAMARTTPDLAPLLRDPRWRLARGGDARTLWTDEYSSLLSILKSE